MPRSGLGIDSESMAGIRFRTRRPDFSLIKRMLNVGLPTAAEQFMLSFGITLFGLIVISLGTTAFVLAMAYRSWQLTGHDDVQDDVEDRAIRRRAAADEASESFDLSSGDAEDELEMPEEEGRRP